MRFSHTTVRAGLFAGLGTALWTLFEFMMGWHGPRMEIGAVTGFVGLIFPIVAILWALRRTKRELGGSLTLGHALRCGLSVSCTFAAVGVGFYFLYYRVINPGFLERLRATGGQTSTSSQLLLVAGSSLILGLVVALLGGLAMRTTGRASAKAA